MWISLLGRSRSCGRVCGENHARNASVFRCKQVSKERLWPSEVLRHRAPRFVPIAEVEGALRICVAHACASFTAFTSITAFTSCVAGTADGVSPSFPCSGRGELRLASSGAEMALSPASACQHGRRRADGEDGAVLYPQVGDNLWIKCGWRVEYRARARCSVRIRGFAGPVNASPADGRRRSVAAGRPPRADRRR